MSCLANRDHPSGTTHDRGRPRRFTDAKGERGAATVEFALVAGLLFTLVFGIIQFGQFYSRYQVFQAAAREGARTAAVRADPVEVVARVEEAADPFELSESPSITVDGVVSQCLDETTAGRRVTVSWEQSFDISLPFVPEIDMSVPIKGVFRCE